MDKSICSMNKCISFYCPLNIITQRSYRLYYMCEPIAESQFITWMLIWCCFNVRLYYTCTCQKEKIRMTFEIFVASNSDDVTASISWFISDWLELSVFRMSLGAVDETLGDLPVRDVGWRGLIPVPQGLKTNGFCLFM